MIQMVRIAFSMIMSSLAMLWLFIWPLYDILKGILALKRKPGGPATGVIMPGKRMHTGSP